MHGGPQLSRQKKKPHSKNKKTFLFAVRFFLSAVRFFLLPWGFFFCRDSCGPSCISYSPLTCTQKANACMRIKSQFVFLVWRKPRNMAPFCTTWLILVCFFPCYSWHRKRFLPNRNLNYLRKHCSRSKSTRKTFFFFFLRIKLLTLKSFQLWLKNSKYLREVWATCQNRKMDDFLTSRLVKIAHWMRFAIIHVMPLWNRPRNKPTVSSLSSRMFYLLLLQERRK